jgi:hypothetical protein
MDPRVVDRFVAWQEITAAVSRLRGIAQAGGASQRLKHAQFAGSIATHHHCTTHLPIKHELEGMRLDRVLQSHDPMTCQHKADLVLTLGREQRGEIEIGVGVVVVDTTTNTALSLPLAAAAAAAAAATTC